MNKRLAAIAIAGAAAAAAAALFASPSKSADSSTQKCGEPIGGCPIALTEAGPSPSTLTIPAWRGVEFYNPDSVTHTVVSTNGLCSLTLAPGAAGGYCKYPFALYVGSYAYTVDGKFPGTVVTTPRRRSVTLTARTHTIRGGTRLTLHGQVVWLASGDLYKPPFPVFVLARRNSKQPFKRIAALTARYQVATTGANGWRLTVRPTRTTTYIAKVTGQYPGIGQRGGGQIWANARSRPLTVRIRP